MKYNSFLVKLTSSFITKHYNVTCIIHTYVTMQELVIHSGTIGFAPEYNCFIASED